MRDVLRVIGIGLAIGLQGAVGAWGQGKDSRWGNGVGAWTEAARWSQGVPGAMGRAAIGGRSQVTLEGSRQVVGGLIVGTNGGDEAVVKVLGGELIVRRNFTQIGEVGPGSGEVVLEAGALHCVGPIYVGAANSAPDRNCKGTLRIRGGSFAARMVTLGWGMGSEATLAIEGSKAEAIHLLDYLTAGSYVNGKPSTCTFAFTLDDQGVTPVVIENPKYGLTLLKGEMKNLCRLQVGLSAPPPREDVPLIVAKAKTKGEFEGLPEGAEVSAEFGGTTYRWTLTYRGGASGCNLMLTKARGFAEDAAVTHTRAIPSAPKLLWTEAPLRPALPKDAPAAFEGAEGFGAISQGGRGGREIVVENLNDSGPGSLREAVMAKGPRIIVFKVGGMIDLKSPLSLREPFVSILGQTAPGAGLTLRGHGMMVMTHDVVLRHLRIRPGDDANDEDAIEFYDAERCIADHCSFGFGSDETCSIVGLSDAITIQHCIISEGLNRKGHSMAAIAGGERTTWHHNLIAHCRTRNPRFSDVTNCDFRNNVVYDWGDTASYGQFERVNLVGNYFKPGPSTTQKPPRFHTGESIVAPNSFFIQGNVLLGQDEMTRENWLGVGYGRGIEAKTPFEAPAVGTESAEAAYESVLENAGATLPRRDAIDRRVVKDTREGTGKIVNTVTEEGGWVE